MSCYVPSQMHSYSNTSQSQQFFNMTGSHLMIYSPVASLGLFSSFHSSDSDNSFRSSFDKEQSEFSSIAHKKFSENTASLTSQRSETYSEVNVDDTDSVVIDQTLHSAPCDNIENNQSSSACVSDHETMKKLGEVKDALNHCSAVLSVGDGESKWRSDWVQSVRKNATTPPFSGQVREKFVGDSSVGGPVDICRIRSGDADDVTPGNGFWQPVENVGAAVTEHDRKKVSFEDGFSWSGYSAAEGEAMVHNVKSQNPSCSYQMDGNNEGNSQYGREFQSIVDSAFDTKRLSTTQSRDPFDYFQNTSFAPACPQSKSTTSLRRRSEPPYLPTMVAKWTVVEELDIGRNGRETQMGTHNRSLNRSRRSRSETYLLHLKNTDRVSRHAEHIVKKYGLDLLDNQSGGSKYEDFHVCLDFANVSANNNIVDYEQQPQGAASLIASGGPEENSDNQIETKSKGFSLRRPFQKFQKKSGPLDKSRSVVGPGLGKSCHEDASPRRPVSADLQAKDSESSFAETSEQKAVERKTKKPHRKFGLNLFRKTRDGFTKESSKDRGQAELEGQGNKDYESSKQAEDVDTSCGYDREVIESSETARDRASIIDSPHQQQEPKLNCPEHLQKQTELTCGSETVSQETSCDIRQDKKKKKMKAESKKELSSKISDGSVPGKDLAAAKSSHVIIPLEAKGSVVFHDAVFYFPPEDKTGCNDENSQPAVSRSESKVPRPSKSSSLRVPAKVAISDAKDKGTIEYSRPSILKRMRAFFARSSSIGNSYNVGQASSSTLLDTASGQDKESRGIEEWRWSGARGQGSTDPVRGETSSSTDLEKSQKEHETKADESEQGPDDELTKTESKLKDN